MMLRPAPTRPVFKSVARTPQLSSEEKEAELERRAMQRLADHGPAMVAVIAEVQAFRAKWRAYVSDDWILRRVADRSDFVWEWEESRARDAMRRTEARAAERSAKALAAPYMPSGDSDMSDADIASAIRFLTSADSDHARDANGEGWSASDNSAGHYCFAMLDQDYPAAIAVGRTLVAKYQRQLHKGGLL